MYVVATAGHVDHGKSTLVTALTAMQPDRLAEEQRRSMTIDLGYAWTALPDGSTMAFVDVPGHERFVGNMLAGVGPVPAVMLVVASDEGWSRQTAEHLAALDALGIRHGLLVVTRVDLMDPGLAIEEARIHLAGTSLADMTAVGVSGRTGEGIEELRRALIGVASGIPAAPPVTRLWLDRVFTIRGAGTVVTGTLTGGSVAIGDQLTIAATGEPVAIRRIECLGEQVNEVHAVARVALNLRGAKPVGLRRGDAFVCEGEWPSSTVMDVRLVNADQRIPVAPIMHVGTAAVSVRLRRLGAESARITSPTTLPLHVGERAVLRDPGRQRVVAGLIVLDTDPPALRRRGDAARRAVDLAAMHAGPDATAEVRRRGAVRLDQLMAAGVLAADQIPAGVTCVGPWLIDPEAWRGWVEGTCGLVDAWAAGHSLSPGMPRAALTRELGLPDPSLVDAIVDEVPDIVSDSDGVHRRDVSGRFTPQVESALAELSARWQGQPFAAPSTPELTALGLSERHLAAAAKAGLVLRVAPGVYLRPDAVELAVAPLADLSQPFTLSEARERLATSRRVAVPLLELLDRRGHTVRVDDQRRRIHSASLSGLGSTRTANRTPGPV